MIGHLLHRLKWLALLAVVLVSLITASATANTVDPSNAADLSQSISANDLKPPECAALNLTSIVVGNGLVIGTKANDLILGGPGDDELRGNGGADCIMGGGGDDELRGGPANDVCIGGPGNDTFVSCKNRYQ